VVYPLFMRVRTSWLFLGAVLGALSACQKNDSDAAPAAAPEPAAATPSEAPGANEVGTADEEEKEAAVPAAAPTEEPTPTQALMRGHFEKAEEAREALVRADMDTAKTAMAWLAGHPLGGVLPEKLQPLLKVMQDTAGDFAKATTLREAGVVLANTLTKCGDCHAAADDGPTIGVTPVPEGDDIAAHMGRHHWAVNRMWEGLVTNDAEAFTAAAEVLAEKPLDAKMLTTTPKDAANAAKLTAYVHELGQKAKDATDSPSRAEAYGNLLATCATCHRMLGRGPKPLEAIE